nr:transcription initiation factor tfiid subunit 13 [Quercus suber]
MAEPRARPRQKGATFSPNELISLLYAYGSNPHSQTHTQLPSTISVLDEILTDFIIETCHNAALCASYSRRQKIKVDDFKWVLRRDEALLGRVLESMWKVDDLKEKRRGFDPEGLGKGDGMGALEEIAELGGESVRIAKEHRLKNGPGGMHTCLGGHDFGFAMA